MIATSSPLHSRSHPLTPQSISANSSPHLRPLKTSMAKDPVSPLNLNSSTFPLPYTSKPFNLSGAAASKPSNHSPVLSRGASTGNIKDVKGDTKEFAELLVHLVEQRVRTLRGGMREGRDGVKSVAGSWEVERVELIVDIPVWSPGCFQDLSTLHALRDTTLAHTHNLLTYLLKIHSLPASYRLLARSALPQTPKCPAPGWGCIRLPPPSKSTPTTPHRELRPAVRRSSLVHHHDGGRRSRKSSAGTSTSPVRVKMSPGDFDEAIASDDEDDDEEGGGKGVVELKEGYRSSGGSDDEGEEGCADVLVAKEVERRGGKEGTAFLMTLFGQPALILT